MGGIRMFVDEGLGHSSYLIDLGDGAAAIVDPQRFPDEHIAAASSSGTTPHWTVDTHSHADYVTGSPGLVADHGVTFIAPTASQLDTTHHGVRDDDIVTLTPGGLDAWRAAGGTIAGISLVDPTEIATTLIDVRQRNEYTAGHVPGAINIELGSLTDTSAEIRPGPVTVMCGHGERAMTGASVLACRGHGDVTVCDGGPDTWAAATGLPLAVER